MNDSRPTRIRARSWMVQVLCLLALTLAWPLSSSADQAQYFYDELGRLSAVVDGAGNAAYYQYDAVGNLLAIVRDTDTAPPTITSVSPGTVQVGTTVTMTITGAHLQGAVVTMANPDVLLKPLPGNSDTTVPVELTVPRLTTVGATAVTVTTPFGEASTTVTILDVLTTVIGTVVDDVGTPIGGAQVDILGGPSGVTAADGSFQFPNLSAYQFASIQVSATTMGLYGASPFVAPVLNGVTDVGTVTVTSPQFDHEFGQALQFDQLGSTFVPFTQGFSFPFYGTTYAGVYVTPRGRLTFEFTDTDPLEHESSFAEQAGIGAFWTSLAWYRGGDIFVKQFPDRLVVTWFQIPDRTFLDFSTFQATIFIGGRIILAYGEMAADGAMVGITPGQSFNNVDFSVDTPLSTTGPVAIYENSGFGGPGTFDLARQLLSFTPNVSEGFDVELSARPEEFTTVVGTVVDEGGAPVSGAIVSILDGPSGVTASDGTFSFADVSIYMPQVLRVTASATVAGQPLFTLSAPTLPVANATTDIGTLTVAPYFFEPDLGERVSLDDDDSQYVDFEHFRFPFYGTFNFSRVRVESNGRLNFGSRDNVKDETVAEFTERPQIAAFFDNLNPSGLGEVYVHQFPNRFVVTWSQVPEFSSIGSNTIQTTLFPDGRILLAYAGMTADDAIIGISPGSSPPFSESDLSADSPFSTTEPIAIYEEFDGPLPADGETVGTDPFDLDQKMVLFVPNSSGGFDVSELPLVELTTTVVGTVVDASGNPVSGIQISTKTGESGVTATDGAFSLTGVSTSQGNIQVSATDFSGAQPLYGVSIEVAPNPMGTTDVGTITVAGPQFTGELGEPLHQGDDDFDLVSFTQGFTFPFYDTTYTQLYANSNGRITFQSGDSAFTETVAELDEQPQIAPFFDNLDPDGESADEAIYINQFPSFVVLTWPRVAESPLWGGTNTFQATLFDDGRIVFSYNGITSDDAIVGISPGNSAALTESNFSTDAPFNTASPVAIYEVFNGPLPDDDEPVGTDPFDLDQKLLTFIPNANGGFDVDITPPSNESGTTTVVGTVVDEVGMPVVGAQVQIAAGPSGVTAGDGTFSLSNVAFNAFASIQVSASIMIDAQEVTGLSPLVPAVSGGTTDVGPMVLGRQYRALGAINYPPQMAFVDLMTHAVTWDTTQIENANDVDVTSDGKLGLVLASPSSNPGDQIVLYDLAVDPPVLRDSVDVEAIAYPFGAAISPNNRFAVISGTAGTNNVVVLDLDQPTIASEVFDVAGNQAAAITPDGTMILVLNYYPREISVLTLDANGVATDTGQRVSIPGFSHGQILITPNGKRALINDLGGRAIDVLAIENGIVSFLERIDEIGEEDYGVTDMAITPDGQKVYVSNYFDSALYVLAIDQNDVITKTGTRILIPAGLFGGFDFPPSTGMGFTFDGRTLMIVGSDRSVLSFVDTVTDTVLPEIIPYPQWSFPAGLATYVAPF